MRTTVRKLRRNQTPPETKLWSYLRGGRVKGVHFRRQYPIYPYIVDFCCVEKKLVIEIDGDFHSLPLQVEKDIARQSYIENEGFSVIRLSAKEVMSNLENVLLMIEEAIEKE